MDCEGQIGAKHHVLLIGIDAYPGHELRGCVNDIDAVQRVLLERLELPAARIRRLVSPLTGTQHETTVAEQPATAASIRAALAELGSDRVNPGDRVFIYYSGHGKRVVVERPDGLTFQREALVPVDFESTQGDETFLFDFEINRRLAAIAARTSSVAVVLDCCHASGATRGGRVRSFERPRDRKPIRDPARELEGTRSSESPGGAGSIGACHVVSACLANEFSREDDHDGAHHGAFTSAFVAAVRDAERVDLRTLTWDRIWQAMRSDVALRSSGQNPRMDGSPGRAVFGGPPVDRDAGLFVSRDGDGYQIAAGTMADITRDTELAIYGPEPACFPPLGSAADIACRVGVARVTDAELAVARATAIGAAFELPAGARGRVIELGASSRLHCAVTPHDAAIEAQLARSSLLQLVGAEQPAQVRLVREGARWYITDDQHGTGEDAPVLFAIEAGDAFGARAVLDHYVRYSLPLRVAARATDLPGGLELRVLACAGTRRLSSEQAQDPELSEAPMWSGRYHLTAGDGACVAVHNRASVELQVTLFDLLATGQVVQLGGAGIQPGARHLFWSDGDLGLPYELQSIEGAPRSRDRLVAIGTTERAHSLDHLVVDKTFTQALQETLGAKPLLNPARKPPPPVDQWAAAQVVIETARKPGIP
jgi:hypothetical protein